ncbi:MAG: heterocyst frequency control protein PatD [Elainellaceae cyanobacterium]
MVDLSQTQSDSAYPLQPLLDELRAHLSNSTTQVPPLGLATTLEPVYCRLRQALGAEKVAPDRQPYLTEFHKQMRLLGTDIGFLKAAQKAETRRQRFLAMGDRLQTLQRYYDAMTAVE